MAPQCAPLPSTSLMTASTPSCSIAPSQSARLAQKFRVCRAATPTSSAPATSAATERTAPLSARPLIATGTAARSPRPTTAWSRSRGPARLERLSCAPEVTSTAQGTSAATAWAARGLPFARLPPQAGASAISQRSLIVCLHETAIALVLLF
eukprot:CAMPEP_0175344530 /NCGR_PEP_ID=MMETSP0095-20121207/7899_1 /TAXON_ID=311494 /ORGANISM="Alexandrium monilatum, Strain CCMP3105" /LENGTH=151 /DNA_ID=CAMNT_0016641969 /DNA_START=105 /DNA_END=560 /DNA_ORIENTATION=+